MGKRRSSKAAEHVPDITKTICSGRGREDVPCEVPIIGVPCVEQMYGGEVRSTSRVERMRQARNRMSEIRKKECLRSAKDMNVMISSKDVDSSLVQDRSKKMVIIGSDVVASIPACWGAVWVRSATKQCWRQRLSFRE